MDARRAVEIAQAESEATGGEPLPEETSGKRRGRPVVQSVRLPAEELAETGADRGAGRGASRGTDPGLGAGRAGRGAGSSLREAIDHLAEEPQRLRRLAATWPEFTVARTWTRWEVIHDTAWR
jgi:hypothetical protein